jgi:exodeoxyribonuclease-3
VVLCGDVNVAHREPDLRNWRGNRTKAGFLPQERAWVDALLGDGWVDVVRVAAGDRDGPYTWWSWRGRAFDNDAGWRIDYQFATAGLAERVACAEVDRPASYAERWSDHAPVRVRYDLAAAGARSEPAAARPTAARNTSPVPRRVTRSSPAVTKAE